MTRFPILRRITWHFSRLRSHIDRRVVAVLVGSILGFVALSAAVVTILERPINARSFGESVYWAVNTLLGSGDTTYVSSPIGWLISWMLIILGLTLLAVATGLLIGFIIDILLKEGQGMGAAGFRDHIVICGWNEGARSLIDELQKDDFHSRIVVLDRGDRNPAGKGVYFVGGDAADPADLARAGIAEASAAIVLPADASDESDMRSILVVMVIESVAPEVRTIVEANNPRHVDHFRRAHADEILVTTELASHLLARSSLYPGLAEVVLDIVSGGDGSELYRVEVPTEYAGLSVDEASARFRQEHGATLISIGRDGSSHLNPSADWRLEPNDNVLVIAASLGRMTPVEAGGP